MGGGALAGGQGNPPRVEAAMSRRQVDPPRALTAEERAELERLARERRHAQAGSGAITARPIRRCRAKASYGSARGK